MMHALVIYESMFGNTRDVALAVAEGIATAMPVQTLEIGAAPASLPSEIDLLVVGGPTHAHGMSTPDSRADSARRAGDRLVTSGPGVREWLDRLTPGSTLVRVATFDTRIKGPGLLWGSAAKAMAKRLRAIGFAEAAHPESFLVGGPTGPQFDRLEPGELERARAWGAALAAKVPVAAG